MWLSLWSGSYMNFDVALLSYYGVVPIFDLLFEA